MALFDNDKDTKERGNNIADRIEKDIKKRKNVKPKGRGMTKKTKFNKKNNEIIKSENIIDDDKYMDLDEKWFKILLIKSYFSWFISCFKIRHIVF